MADFPIRVVVDPRGAQTGTRQVNRSLQSVERNANRVRAALGTAFAATGASVALAQSVRLLADFDQQLSTVAAISGATGAEFDALSERAQELGTNTRFSATQAAEGLVFLSRAGFDAAESLETIDDTLTLAQAGGLDLASAADIAANALRGFRLDTGEAGRVVDVLALAANSANTNVFELGDALSFTAPVAAGLGVSIELATAAIGALSDAGVAASRAGTGLNRVLSALESPTSAQAAVLDDLGVKTEEVRVSQVGLIEALERLAAAGIDTGTALTLFGERGGPAFEILASNIPRVAELEAALNDAGGTAARVSEIMDDNLNGALLSVRSAFEGLVLAFGDTGGTEILEESLRGVATILRTLAANTEELIDVLTAAGVLFGTVRVAPYAQSLANAAEASAALRLQTIRSQVVILASAQADRAKAAAALEAAEAEVARTTALVASARAQAQASALTLGAAAADRANAARAKAIANAQSAQTAATEALTAAQARYNVAGKASLPIFGSIRSGLLRAAGALRTFGALLAANPIALIVTALGAAVAALILFRDQISLTGDGLATVGDLGRALLESLQQGFSAIAFVIQDTLAPAFEALRERLGFLDISFGDILRNAAIFIDGLNGLFLGLARALPVIIRGGLGAFNDALVQDLNRALETVEGFINDVIDGFNSISSLIGIDPLENIDFGEITNNFEGEAEALGQAVNEAFVSGFEFDTTQRFVEDLFARAEEIAQSRTLPVEIELTGDEFLFGDDLDEQLAGLTSGFELPGPARDVPAADFSELLQGLRDEAELLKLSNQEYEIRRALIQAEEDLGRDFQGDESAQVEAILRQNQALADQAEILDRLRGPQEAFERGVAAIDALLAQGSIDIEEYNAELERLRAQLEGDVDTSGFEGALRRIRTDFGDLSSQTADLVGTAFGALEKNLLNFLDDASFSIRDFLNNLANTILQQTAQTLFRQGVSAGLGALGVGTIPQFANGGSFMVGGAGGTDSQFVAFKASPDERVTVETPAQQAQSQQQSAPPEVNLSVVNTMDPQAAVDAQDTAEGRRVFMNNLRLVRSDAKRVLGV